MRNLALTALAFLLLSGCSTQRLSPAEKAGRESEVAQQVQEAVENRRMAIDIHYATPFRSGIKHLDYGYGVRISGDTLHSRLPYFGRAYNIPYGGGKALNFSAPIKKYTSTRTRKGFNRVTITVRNAEDQYQYTMELFDNGHADVVVVSRERDPISFSGQLVNSKQQ